MNNEYENMKQDLEEDWTVGESHFHSKQAAGVTIDGDIAPNVAANSQTPKNNDDWAVNTMVGSGPVSMPSNPTKTETSTANSPDTNPLSEVKSDKWRMPEPVFRVSGGKKIEKSVQPAPPLNAAAKSPESSEPAITSAAIQPQPDISEEFLVGNVSVIEEPTAKVKSKTTRMIFIVAGISAMVLFAVGFLIGIYFLFFRQTEL